MSKFEILCVTMHQNDFSKIKEMNIHSDVVFANQCDRTAYEEIEFEGHTAKMISTQTRGVGKNRNLGMLYATADISLFADDDVVYDNDCERIVCDFYAQHPDADVVIFNFMESRNGSEPKTIVDRTRKLKRKALTYGTYAISVRRSALDWHNIKFHHLFGGGTPHSCGEDTMFLNECFSKKLTVYTCKEIIGTVNHRESLWFEGYTEKYFLDKGILFYLLVKRAAPLAALYHCFKHRAEYSEIGWRNAFKLMRKGVRLVKKQLVG